MILIITFKYVEKNKSHNYVWDIFEDTDEDMNRLFYGDIKGNYNYYTITKNLYLPALESWKISKTFIKRLRKDKVFMVQNHEINKSKKYFNRKLTSFMVYKEIKRILVAKNLKMGYNQHKFPPMDFMKDILFYIGLGVHP